MVESVTAAELRAAYGRTVEERFAHRLALNVPSRSNPKVVALVERINQDDELYALWLAANVNAVERLGMTDHGPVHVKIVMNIAVKLLRMLVEHGVEPAVVANYGMTADDAEVVVMLAALMHDLGMSIHRKDHEEFSLFVAQAKIRELLAGLYDVATATILRAEILHAIIAHRSGGRPLTLEAGIVRVADALDMEHGRSRVSLETHLPNIHSLSAAAIDEVRILPGEQRTVRVEIDMNNSAGVFQVDELLARKLRGSGLEDQIEVVAQIEAEHEKRLLTVYRI
jgi:uncharacterized protein